MSSLTIRLDPELEKKLGKLAEDRELTRSEVAREALERLVREHERETQLKQMIAEYRVTPRAESLAFAQEALPTDNEALAKAERMNAKRVRRPAKRCGPARCGWPGSTGGAP